MGNCLVFWQCRKHTITDKSLDGVANVVEYLKDNLRLREIFRNARNDQRVMQIARDINRGGTAIIRSIEENSVRDVGAALQYFLIYLRKPLIPIHIQVLVLDSDQTIEPRMIAQDVLGLIKQDLEPKCLDLLRMILDLLHSILVLTPTDELSGCNVPISMMPIFFQMQVQHLSQWRRVATIFVEIIRLAPEVLDILHIPMLDTDGFMVDNFLMPRGPRMGLPNPISLQNRVIDVNRLLRRFILRTGR